MSTAFSMPTRFRLATVLLAATVLVPAAVFAEDSPSCWAVRDEALWRPQMGSPTVWMGKELWSGDGFFDPGTRQWRKSPAGVPPLDRAYRIDLEAWTGRELLDVSMWAAGQKFQGFLFDPVTGVRRSLPDGGAPPALQGATLAWNGKELLALGGAYGISGVLTRSVWIWELATGSWRELASGLLPPPGTWNRGEGIDGGFVVAGSRGMPLRSQVWSYESATGRWSEIRLPSGLFDGPQTTHREIRDLAVAGRYVFFGSEHGAGDDEGAWGVYDLETRHWTIGSFPTFSQARVLAAGGRFVLGPGPSSFGCQVPCVQAPYDRRFWTLAPGETRWWPLVPPADWGDGRTGNSLPPFRYVDSGEELLVIRRSGGWDWWDSSPARSDLWEIDVEAGRFRRLWECRPAPRTSPAIAAGGGKVFVWGGLEGDPSAPVGDGWIFDPTTGSRETVVAEGAPSPRQGAAAAWTGSEWVVWGGWAAVNRGEPESDGAAYDPVRRRWRSLSDEGVVPTARGWGTLAPFPRWLVVWGGDYLPFDDPRPGGRYDLRSDRWETVSEVGAPGRWGGTQIGWGAGLVVVFGYDVKSSWAPAGAAYDPNSDRWTELPGELLDGLESGVRVASDGAIFFFLSASGGSGQPLTIELRSWDPASGVVATYPDLVFPNGGPASSWQGVLAAGGGQVVVTGAQPARFDLARGSWELLPPSFGIAAKRLVFADPGFVGLSVDSGVELVPVDCPAADGPAN